MVAQRHRVRPACRPTPRASPCSRPMTSRSTYARCPRSGTTAAWCAPGCWSWRSAPSQADPALDRLRGYVDDSGEGRWTVQEAVERAVPGPRPRRRALQPLRLPRRQLVRDAHARRASQRVRRPPRPRGVRPAGAALAENDAFIHTRDTWHHGTGRGHTRGTLLPGSCEGAPHPAGDYRRDDRQRPDESSWMPSIGPNTCYDGIVDGRRLRVVVAEEHHIPYLITAHWVSEEQ